MQPDALRDALLLQDRPVHPSATSILLLQRTAGNRAVGEILGAPPAPTEAGPAGETAVTVQRQEAADSGGPGPATQGAGDISVYVGRTMTAEAALREIYSQGAGRITREAVAMVARGESVTDAARWASEARNDLKVKIRARGSPITRGLAEARNTRKYGNKVGPTYDDLIRQGKTPEDIIGSAGRADAKVTKVATKMRVAGRLLIAVDIAIVTWEVFGAPEGERLKAAVEGAGGIAGAAGGGWAGAKLGGAIGTAIAPGLGTAIGAGIGAIGGALFGGWAGRKAARKGYEVVEDLFTPNLDRYMADIDAAQDEAFRKGVAEVREIESRTVGAPGRREYVAPGGGRIPEY